MATTLKSQETVMSAEKFQNLIANIRLLVPPPVDPTVITDAANKAVMEPKSKGSFSNSLRRFSGYNRRDDCVEKFITHIETYKQTEDISDEDALKGLQFLFVGMAAIWWKGVKRDCKTWNEALIMLRENFEPTKPAYQIYRDIFEMKQDDNISIESYVCQQRVLLAKLPVGRHDEQTELDFIYGLLNPKYRKQITRREIKSFRDLLEKGRYLEKFKFNFNWKR